MQGHEDKHCRNKVADEKVQALKEEQNNIEITSNNTQENDGFEQVKRRKTVTRKGRTYQKTMNLGIKINEPIERQYMQENTRAVSGKGKKTMQETNMFQNHVKKQNKFLYNNNKAPENKGRNEYPNSRKENKKDHHQIQNSHL